MYKLNEVEETCYNAQIQQPQFEDKREWTVPSFLNRKVRDIRFYTF